MTRAFFDEQMDRLLALRFPPESINGHWDALKELPADLFGEAVTHALKTRVVFPVPAELRADADHVAPLVFHGDPLPQQARDLEEPFTITVPQAGKVVSVTREWKYYCSDCDDTGWQSVWCGQATATRQPWQPFHQCDRRNTHDPHEHVRHCACYHTNPALVRKREAGRKYADKPQRVA